MNQKCRQYSSVFVCFKISKEKLIDR